MENKQLRRALDHYADDRGFEEPPMYFTNHSYDNSIIGFTEDGKTVYSLEKMIEEYMEDEGCSYEEAIEWIEYNTLGSLSMADGRIIIINDTIDFVIENYDYGDE